MHLKVTIRQFTLVIASLFVGLLAISQQSFWMDEGGAAIKAFHSKISDWWYVMLQLGGSDVQMPVYMFFVWCWQKLGFISEYGLRTVNLPWLVLGTLALSRVRYWPVVFLISPFVWYYVGELRPYAMQIAAGSVAAAALLRIIESRSDDPPWRGFDHVAFASLFLAACSLTGALWALGLWSAVMILKPQWFKTKVFWQRIIPWALGAMIIGGYYIFTLLRGYRATSFEGGLASMMFGFYELMGFVGLGPGRNEIRANPFCLIQWLPILIPAMFCIGAVWLRGVILWVNETPKQTIIAVAVSVGIPLVLFAAVSVFMDFRVLGRHLSPMLPFFLLPMARCIRECIHGQMRWKVLACAALALWVVSFISICKLERHARDDYRRASEFAFEALKNGRKVWWQADMNVIRYYAYRKGGAPYVQVVQPLESDPPSGLMFADLVVINRPDIRFAGKDYQGELRRNFFKPVARFTGFEIWRAN